MPSSDTYYACGEKHPGARLTDEAVLFIRRSGWGLNALAAQFGVSTAKIHKITERCKARVAEAFKERAVPKTDCDKCPRCGRIYAEWNFSQCARNGPLQDESLRCGLIGPTWEISWKTVRWPLRHLDPDCLPYRYWSDATALQKKYFGIG